MPGPEGHARVLNYSTELVHQHHRLNQLDVTEFRVPMHMSCGNQKGLMNLEEKIQLVRVIVLYQLNVDASVSELLLLCLTLKVEDPFYYTCIFELEKLLTREGLFFAITVNVRIPN